MRNISGGKLRLNTPIHAQGKSTNNFFNNNNIFFLNSYLTRQSVAVQRDGASPVDQKVPVINTPGMNF